LYLKFFSPQIFDIHPKGLYRFDKDVGYVLNPGFEGIIQREEFKTKIHINKNGLIGKSYEEKTDSIYRILVLGDSFAFGFGVEENETFSIKLEKLLNAGSRQRYEVINAGVPGYGTVDQLNFLKSRGKDIKPDLVIMQFLSDNDFSENTWPANTWADVKDGWLTVKNDKNHSSNIIPSWREVESFFKNNFHSAKFLSERVGYLLLKSGLIGDDLKKNLWGEIISGEEEKIFKEAVVEVFNYTRENSSDFIFLFTTGQGQVLSDKDPNLFSEDLVRNTMSKNNIQWINVYRIMRMYEEKNSLYYKIDGHWNSAGHKFVSEVLLNELLR
jgi:hypothetical protein